MKIKKYLNLFKVNKNFNFFKFKTLSIKFDYIFLPLNLNSNKKFTYKTFTKTQNNKNIIRFPFLSLCELKLESCRFSKSIPVIPVENLFNYSKSCKSELLLFIPMLA